MSELKPENRSWDPSEGEAAITELKESIERLRQHVKTFRAERAPKTQDETPEKA